jgi:hypothetical protein
MTHGEKISRNQRGGAAKFLTSVLIVVGFFGFLYWWFSAGPNSADYQPDVGVDDQSADDVPVEEPVDPPGEDEPEEPEEPVEEPVNLVDEFGEEFSFLPVGDLLPESGPGFTDETVYRPDMLFPTEDAVFLNSQVYRYGGMHGDLNGMNGGQCNAENYAYPWQDTFCEKRSRNQELCPGGGHEGLDIRPATCEKNAHWAVAVEDARVVDIRRHWVTLQTADGTLYNYLHLDMGALQVEFGDDVIKGERIGRISNDFFNSSGDRTSTTIHLHFEMYENYTDDADEEPLFTKVNPYMTLVAAYDRKLRE